MNNSLHKAMPDVGQSAPDVLNNLDAFKEHDPNYKEGRVWSLVYYLDEDHSAFLKDSYHRYACENGRIDRPGQAVMAVVRVTRHSAQ